MLKIPSGSHMSNSLKSSKDGQADQLGGYSKGQAGKDGGSERVVAGRWWEVADFGSIFQKEVIGLLMVEGGV